jgi:DNA-binding response OmpR family regulator
LATNNSPFKIIVINNDRAMTEMINAVLEPKNFKVYIENSNNNGVKDVHQYGPDVIIIGQLLPHNDGIRICKEIRSFSNVPILVLSAVNKPGMVERVLDAGADEFILRPVSPNILIAHLNTLARRSREEKKAEYRLTEIIS